jgi:hypothetical protein
LPAHIFQAIPRLSEIATYPQTTANAVTRTVQDSSHRNAKKFFKSVSNQNKKTVERRRAPMKAMHSTFSPGLNYQRLDQEKLSLAESLKIYFTILSGVVLFLISLYHMQLLSAS